MRDFIRLFVLVIFLFLISSEVFALTLAEALQIAEQHPVLQLHDLNIQGRQHEKRDAAARGATGLSLTSENFGGHQTGFSDLETTFELTLPIQDAHKVRARQKLGDAAISLTQQEKIADRWQIMAHTTRAFHKALSITSLIEGAQANIDNSQKLVSAARIMVESGAVAEQEIYQAALLLQQAELEKKTLADSLAEAKAELAIAMGLEELVDSTIIGSITDDIELPGFDQLELMIKTSHPEIRNRESEIAEAEARLQILRSDNRPAWNVVAGARNQREMNQNDFLIGIAAELPRSRDNHGARLALKKDIARLRLTQINTQRELRLKLLSAWQKLTRLKEQSQILRDKILPDAHHLFELSLEGYQLGKTDQIVVLQAQREYLQQKNSYLQRLNELYEAYDYIGSLVGSGSKPE